MSNEQAEKWSVFQSKVAVRFENDVYSNGDKTAIGMYLYLLNAPEQTGCEEEISEYWENNPDISLKELYMACSNIEDKLYPNGYNCDDYE